MIEVSKLVKYFGNRQILQNLTFSVNSGRVCGFLGPNGSGKSTTMDILAGLLGPSSGVVKICGNNVVTQTTDVKACIGYLPDNPPLYKEMYVVDFINFAAQLRGLKGNERKKSVDSIIDECDIGDVKHRLIGNLSKGYRQRVALSTALVHKPKVLVLDEPTEGLDPTQIVLIRNLIKKLAQERTVILSSHILSEVQATCNEVIIIVQGVIRAKFVLDDNALPERQYIYKFSSNLENALQWFKEQKYVKVASLDINTNEITVEFDFASTQEQKKFNLETLTKNVVLQNFSLIGLREKKSGLEEMFFEVIRTTPSPDNVNT